MPRVVRVLCANLHYRPGIRVHTATSGPIDALQELYLLVEQDDEPLGCAGIRINVAYLTKIEPRRIVESTVAAVKAMDWRGHPEELICAVHDEAADLPTPVRALLDCLLHDWAARAAGQPLAAWLGGEVAEAWPTNQSLFWGDDAALEAAARGYLARGFHSLKLRIGVADFAADLRRLSRLREIAGPQIEIAVDVNGRWSLDAAIANMQAMSPLHVAYVEQPLPADDWAGLRRLCRETDIPIMLDESLAQPSDIERLLSLPAPPNAHLKLVKMGGVRPLLDAGRRLMNAGVDVMVGQMNEGALATAAAAHCAMVLKPRFAELYGADGLVDDPASGLNYADGRVLLPRRPGLGPELDRSKTTEIVGRTL